jgi:oligopeptide/dipeptide ABC transporter ATP-binding protein
MLLVTHDIAVAARADRIVVLYAGRIVEQGAATRVLNHPTHPYSAGLIAAVPKLEAVADRARRLPTMPGAVPSPATREAGCGFLGRCPAAADGCQDEQPLLDLGGGHSCACHRSAQLLAAGPLIELWRPISAGAQS